jgi:hypothetical protein
MAPQLTVLQRLENLERANQELDQKLNTTFDRLRSQVAYVMEVVDALTVVFKDGTAELTPIPDLETLVETKLLARREQRKKERVEQENKQLANLVEMGVVKPAEKITANSLIVGRSFDSKGEVVGIGREQFEFGNLHPSVKDQFMGKEVGFLFESNGNKLEVLEIYEIQPQNEVKTEPTTAPTEATGA